MSFWPWLKFALKHIPDNSDENPVENLDAWHEAEAKAKTTQAANVGKEIKTWHPSGFLVLWWDRIAHLTFTLHAVHQKKDIQGLPGNSGSP